MRFTETDLQGLWLIEREPHSDSRGSFARSFCEREFAAHGLETRFVQHSQSYSRERATLRGMHFQKEPHAEVKLVSCIAGAILDVAVDLRPGSSGYLSWRALVLTPGSGRQLYIPKGFAHGFQTLTDDAVVHYLISQFHAPEAAWGVRYDDPAIGIDWPLPPSAVSDKDRAWPLIDVPAIRSRASRRNVGEQSVIL